MSFDGNVVLDDISLEVHSGEVVCLLGDNGAGKSTLIKILSGVHHPDSGQILVDDEEVKFRSPRDALERGIATVFQDLSLVPTMSVTRSFFLGREPTRGRGPFRRLDLTLAEQIAREELNRIGIELADLSRPVAVLSGGQRQAVAIARAAYFGAAVAILDEPTSALGVREAEIVLRYIDNARERGLGIIFITHNIHHAYPIGDTFVVLAHGRNLGAFAKGEITRDHLLEMMAGGTSPDRQGRLPSD
jgi:simple sugar transport system ATP-binding protein